MKPEDGCRKKPNKGNLVQYRKLARLEKLTMFSHLHAPAVDLVSDPLTQPPMSSRGAEPSSASAVSVMLDPLLGTVFHTIFTKSMTPVFLSVV